MTFIVNQYIINLPKIITERMYFMKKTKIKKAVALLLVMMMIAALTACSGNSIVGKWKYRLDFSKYAEQMTGSGLEALDDTQKTYYEEFLKAFDDASVDIIIEFKDDGTFTINMDEDSVKAAEDKIKEGLRTALPKAFTAMGIDIDSYLTDAKITMEQFVENALQSLNLSELQTSLNSGKYRYEDGKIYTGEDEVDESSYLVVELKNDTLTVTDVVGEAGGFDQYKEAFLPMEFTKIN